VNAVVKFQRVPKPVTRPVYRRSDLLSFRADWIAANRDLLVAWFAGSPQADWEMFVLDQYERECDRHDEHKQTYRGP
jgi:hypothetical protein